MMYKKYLLLMIFIFFSKLIFGQGDPAIITLTPSSQTVYNLTDPISIQVDVEGVVGLFAISVTLSYDSSIIKCLSITEGTFLQSNVGGYDVFFETFPEELNSKNYVIVDQSILGLSSVTGTGHIFEITFDPVGVGRSEVKVTSSSLRDINNVEIPVVADSAEINISLSVVNTKIFLEGPFSSGAMSTDLNNTGYLPLIQPYSSAPWNYSGYEMVDADFFSTHLNIVDWVLIQLRTGTSANATVATRAALLKSNGTIVDLNGVDPVAFFVPTDVEYYIVIKHRNHLSIMSSISMPLSVSTFLYNFTTGQNKAYGINPMNDLGGGVFGLFTADTDGNGIVNAADRSDAWNQRNLSGYFGDDVNLDGTVNAADRSVIWNNRNKITQLP
jgi:hypothetical protein